MSHNKKRNTALLFEILIKEQTKCVLSKHHKKANFIEKIINSFFAKNTILAKELEFYRILTETKSVSNEYAERILSVVKQERDKLDEEKLWESQSKLISLINKTLGPSVFSNFVPDYTKYASINIIFNKNAPLSERMGMEQVIKECLVKEEKKMELVKEDVNLLHFRKFMENFNEKYSSLLDEQKDLLNQFLLFKFGDKIDFKVYLNRECSRLLNVIEENKIKAKDDSVLYENINKCIDNLKSSSVRYTDDVFIYSIMKYQEMARELKGD